MVWPVNTRGGVMSFKIVGIIKVLNLAGTFNR